MRVLDLDLDFFLDDTTDGLVDWGDRLPDDRYPPWSAPRVRAFLEDQCGLRRGHPVRGRRFEHHDEAFNYWRTLVRAGDLATPFDLVHVDAHGDFGSTTWEYVHGIWLHRPVAERHTPPREEVLFNNYLLFAFGARWVRDYTFVYPPTYWPDMLNFQYDCREDDPEDCAIHLAVFRAEDLVARVGGALPRPVAHEPPVPFHKVPSAEYRAAGPFDIVTIARSPKFTPKAADALFDLVGEYVADDR